MRWALAFALFAAGALSVPVVHATPALHWVAWATDPQGDGDTGSVDPRMDAVGFDVAMDATRLHLRLRHAQGPVPEDAPDPLAGSTFWAMAYNDRGAGRSFDFTFDANGLKAGAGAADYPSGSYGTEPGSHPWGYEAWIDLGQILEGQIVRLDRLKVDVHGAAGSDELTGGLVSLSAAGGTAFGAAHQAAAKAGGWIENAGPDFGGGPSVALGPDGAVHVAYYVYNAGRGTQAGLYHAVVGAAWTPTRLADYAQGQFPDQSGHPRDPRDEAERTKVAVDGRLVVVLASVCPEESCAAPLKAFVQKDGGAWATEDPSAGLAVGNTHRDVSDLAARGGRVVAALDLQDERVGIVERTGDGSWRQLKVLEQARLPRIALDAAGKAHVAWMKADPGQDSVDLGALQYAKETDAWSAAPVVDGVEDRSGFWPSAETDGSYAFALDPAGTPCFAWDVSDGRSKGAVPERGFGCLRDGQLAPEAAPLTPVHGNPQLTMRLAFDAAGAAHVASGYGGTDLYARRDANGTWASTDVDRHDMWAFTVSPGGVPVFAYTQPHGGTTVAVSALPSGLGPGAVHDADVKLQAGARHRGALELASPVAPAIGLLLLALARRRL